MRLKPRGRQCVQSTELCPDHDTQDGGGGPKEERYEERRIEGMKERLTKGRRTGRNEGTIERVWKT